MLESVTVFNNDTGLSVLDLWNAKLNCKITSPDRYHLYITKERAKRGTT